MNFKFLTQNMRTLILIGISAVLFSCAENSQEVSNNEQDSEKVSEQSLQLASWETAPRTRILEWIDAVTSEGSSDFIPEKDRIAVFDNDGTLWSEQPIYFQVQFAIDEIKRMAPEHPEWKTEAPFKFLLEGDISGFLASGDKALPSLLAMTHSGMTTDEFDQHVRNWVQTATHPKTGKHYNEMIYQPMLELLDFLRENGFKTFIVSGGGVDFMRVWAEEAYGIPPYQVVGSTGGLSYEMEGDIPVLKKLPELFFNDDKAGKPVGIHRSIGKRPVFAGGNSDGDYEMLQYTMTGEGARFGLFVHHTDSVREVAYDRDSHIGQLNKGLDDAAKYKWMIVDMAKDWKVIYPFELGNE